LEDRRIGLWSGLLIPYWTARYVCVVGNGLVTGTTQVTPVHDPTVCPLCSSMILIELGGPAVPDALAGEPAGSLLWSSPAWSWVHCADNPVASHAW
jgi:hypothetical protein